MKRNHKFIIVCLLFIGSCQDNNENTTTKELDSNFQFFHSISSANSGLNFKNQIEENTTYNTFLHDAMLQGAGVGILDVNNDGLQDVYICGNQVGDQLFLNKGNLKFEDITQQAKLVDDGTWSTGVSIVDINGDGFDDIYVCKFFYDDQEKLVNKLYINNQDGSFTEKAKEYGIDDSGYSIMANFFDSDGDGDLDLYVANQPPNSYVEKKKLKGKRDTKYTDRLYRNDNGRYTDVTSELGLENYNYSLSATASDFNNDGLTDLYIACDYEEPDMLLINQGNGVLKDDVQNAFRHMGNFSMGSDVADINNDGHLDIYTVDMVAEDNYRQKTNMSGMNPEKFWNLVNNGYHYQYMFNSLQLNNGNGTFSEIAQMANVSNTDWSWAPVFLDVDQDGYKDIIVSNGLFKDLRNKDFEKRRKAFIDSKGGKMTVDDVLQIALETPSVKIKNYAFRNNGDLTFEKKNDEWGISQAGWSQGMAYADFDNDGDLDLVMNNTNTEMSLYENKSSDDKYNNYINIKIKGSEKNRRGFNARINLDNNGKKQVLDHTPYRGYMSSCEAISHFGLGQNSKNINISVRFADGRVWEKDNIKPNQTLVIDYAQSKEDKTIKDNRPNMFTKVDQVNDPIVYSENEFDDYKREVLIPYKMSTLGPVMAASDVNADGRTDFYIGGASGQPGRLYVATDQGTHKELASPIFEQTKAFEDGGAYFVDIDKDGDQDLYVASGGNEYPNGSKAYQDRLYLNDGKGGYISAIKALGLINVSSSSVSFPDFDNDGDLDIFIGGRQIPGQYGRPSSSLLLEQNGGSFVNVTSTKAAVFQDLGMVTSSKWEDINGDNKKELIVTGEWMPIQVFSYDGDQMINTTPASLKDETGMWNTLEIADLDGDGIKDIIAGNMGLNNKYKASKDEPFKLFVNDFDKNGTSDVYLGFYEKGKCYPVRGRQCSSEQMPFVKEKYESYDLFAQSTVEDVLDGKTEGMTVNSANNFAHMIYYGTKEGEFISQKLPSWSQCAPSYTIIIDDFNNDGRADIFTAGNYYNREVETTRSDAGMGYVLLNQGGRKFKEVHPSNSGIRAYNDVRASALLLDNGKKTIAVANNNAPMEFYSLNE